MSFSTTNSSNNRVVYGSNSLAVKGARFTRRGGGSSSGGTSYNYYYSQPQGDSNGNANSDGLLSVGSSSINMNAMKTLDRLQQVPKSGSTGSTTASVGIASSSHSATGESNGLSILYPSSTNKSAVGTSASSYALNSNASPKVMGSGIGSSVLSSRLDNKQMSPLDEKHPYNLGAGNGSMGQQNIAPVSPSAISTAVAPTHNYWMYPSRGSVEDDIVTIHVCDESQQTSRDFCCKRAILVKNMKYFEKFLADNESGYDDIDISVHCDVEIFEWLMNYIHNKVGEEGRTAVVNLAGNSPNSPNKSATLHIDKSILISILISSEFLQMDSLVDICIQNVASNLNEIIKLPIDLSCISERLINRIAAITPSRMLADTRDKKDKILTKLYKRRVELDFSRKGSTKGSAGTSSSRTIAASLTCCRYCGWVYLESYVAFLTCRNSPSTIDFRGRLSSRHYSVTGWSLTSYLKTLHAGGMGWDAIYWHVWAACVVLRVNETFISVLEADRYTVESDGLLIRNGIVHESDLLTISDSSDGGATAEAKVGTAGAVVKAMPSFSLGLDDCGGSFNSVIDFKTQKMLVSKSNDEKSYPFMGISCSSADGLLTTGPIPTSSLNPNRPPECLTAEIFELIGSQMKFIVGLSHRQLIQNTATAVVENFAATELTAPGTNNEFFEIMWGYGAPTLFQKDGNGVSKASKSNGAMSEYDEIERRRGRSPLGRGSVRASSLESRKPAMNLNNPSKFKSINTIAGSKNGSVSEKGGSSNDSGNDSDSNNYDSDEEQIKERKPRSYSLGNSRISRLNHSHNNTSKGNNNGISSTRKKPDILSSSSQATANDTQAVTSAAAAANKSLSYADVLAAKQIAILKTIPPDLMRRFSSVKGPIFNTWMVGHPLVLQSQLHSDVVQTISESQLSESKKLEWELDVLREHDEKKMDRLEKILISKRNIALEQSQSLSYIHYNSNTTTSDTSKPSRNNKKPFLTLGASSHGAVGTLQSSYNGSTTSVSNNSGGNRSTVEYYMDRGRQPNKY